MADSILQSERRMGTMPLTQATVSRRLSWGAILAGVVVSVCVQTMLTVLGVAVGAATVDAARAAASTMGIGAGIWLAVSGIISFYCGGWSAGRLAGIPRAVESTMHGFLAWCLTLVLGMVLFTSAVTGILGAASNLMGQASAGGTRGQIASSLSALAGRATDQIGEGAGATLAGFFMLLLGAGAGALGGYVSTPKNTILTSLPAWERRSPVR